MHYVVNLGQTQPPTCKKPSHNKALTCAAAAAAIMRAVVFKLHIFCTGPITPGLATFILEGGGGSPGITMAG
jgi:hypothetical protein